MPQKTKSEETLEDKFRSIVNCFNNVKDKKREIENMGFKKVIDASSDFDELEFDLECYEQSAGIDTHIRAKKVCFDIGPDSEGWLLYVEAEHFNIPVKIDELELKEDDYLVAKLNGKKVAEFYRPT